MRPSVCYIASYDPEYARNVDVVRALKAAGARVEVVRGPGAAARGPNGGSPVQLMLMALGLTLGTLLRVLDVTLRLLRCQVLVVGYLGQVDMLVFGPLARCLGRPVIFNPLVTLTDTLIEDRRLVSRGTFLARIVHLLDSSSLRLADLVLVDTEENAVYAAALAGLERARVLVVPVGADESVFYPEDGRGSDESGSLDVLYYGKFIPLHGVETIVRAAALLQSTQPDVRFELIGTGQEYVAARNLAKELQVDSVTWTDWLPYSELGNRLRKADVALGIFDGGEKATRVIPNKVHQALASGVPVITRSSPAATRLLVDRESAMVVPPDDPAALAAALVELAGDRELRRSIGRAGRVVWECHAGETRLAALAGEALERVGVST